MTIRQYVGDEIGSARFTRDGRGFNPVSGESSPRGTNVVYHSVFWDVTYAWAHHTRRTTGANLVWNPEEPSVQQARREALAGYYGPARRVCAVAPNEE